MPRLTHEEIQRHSTALAEWQVPQEMRDYSEELMEHVGSKVLFNQAGLTFILEAKAAAIFAKCRTATLVRLIPGEWPDFELKFKDHVESFEFVEADKFDRRRGEEYKNVEDGGFETEDWPVEEWISDAEQVPRILRDRALKKAGKNYPNTANLLIYLNIDEFGIRHSETVASFKNAVEPARNRFKSIWILWKDQSYEA